MVVVDLILTLVVDARTTIRDGLVVIQDTGIRGLEECQCLNHLGKPTFTTSLRMWKGVMDGLTKNGAQAIVSTIAQFAMEWTNCVTSDWVIIDEAAAMSEGQFVQI